MIERNGNTHNDMGYDKASGKYATPAEIEAKREARRLKKQKLREELLSRGLDPDFPAECQFIERPILLVPHGDNHERGLPLSIMTYNCLAQTLIRREMFPESGPALKWFVRSKVLLHEIKHYNADICCLQEIDDVQYDLFWSEELPKFGYKTIYFHQDSKSHGVMIAWKEELFQLESHMNIEFDREAPAGIQPRTRTNNVGLLVALAFTDAFRARNNRIRTSRSGVIIGTFHLFWHPFGTYDRTRQCLVIKKKILEFAGTVKGDYCKMFTGDFNSQPNSVPYLVLTQPRAQLNTQQRTSIEASTAYRYSERRNLGKEYSMEEEEEEEEEEEKREYEYDQGTDPWNTPRPDEFDSTEEQRQLVNNLIDRCNDVPLCATSLYSIGYHTLDPTHIADHHEPELSSWSTKWAGLLDYIFYVNQRPSTPATFETANNIAIAGYLQMPTHAQMHNHSQPYTGEYPSDHISMMCALEIY